LSLDLDDPRVSVLILKVLSLETSLWLLNKLEVLHFIFKFTKKCNYARRVVCCAFGNKMHYSVRPIDIYIILMSFYIAGITFDLTLTLVLVLNY